MFFFPNKQLIDQTVFYFDLGILLKKVRRGSSPTRDRDFSGSDDESAGPQRISWDPQDLGDVNSHTEYFRKIRDNRMERFMVETNKLIIRLDKLAHDAPSDARQRAGDHPRKNRFCCWLISFLVIRWKRNVQKCRVSLFILCFFSLWKAFGLLDTGSGCPGVPGLWEDIRAIHEKTPLPTVWSGDLHRMQPFSWWCLCW